MVKILEEETRWHKPRSLNAQQKRRARLSGYIIILFNVFNYEFLYISTIYTATLYNYTYAAYFFVFILF